jgi:hypothetical protein
MNTFPLYLVIQIWNKIRWFCYKKVEKKKRILDQKKFWKIYQDCKKTDIATF